MVSHGVPESIVNTLQGRAPPSEYRVLVEHYWSPRHEVLRRWCLEHSPCLFADGSCVWVAGQWFCKPWPPPSPPSGLAPP